MKVCCQFTACLLTEHKNGVHYDSIIMFSTKNVSDWPHSFLGTVSALDTMHYPTKSLCFWPWASDWNSWGLRNGLATLETAVEVPNESNGTTRTVFSIAKDPTETTHLPTIWWHRLKYICFGPELCQLKVQWPWWQHGEQKPLPAARSVSY